MFVKKTSEQRVIGNVRYIHGFVRLINVNLNVICYESDGMLIDTGAAALLNNFKPFFNEVKADQVVITHAHEDHTGGAAYLQKKWGLPIYMNESTIKESAKKAAYPMYRKLFWGKREPFQATPIGKTITTKNANWQVIATPGHARDHLAFLNNNTGQLFSGDLYVHPYTKLILREESIPTIIRSIEKLSDYDFGEVFCCHAGYIKNGKKAFQKKLQYLKELEGRILSLYQKGYSVNEIQHVLFKRKYPITSLSFGEWDAKHIITSILQDKYI